VVVEAVKKLIRPLAGVNVVVCLKKEKGGKKFQEKTQKRLDRADIVRDGLLVASAGTMSHFTDYPCRFKRSMQHHPML
jgi:hypothetical protein